MKVIFHSDSVDQEKTGFLIKINASIEGMKCSFHTKTSSKFNCLECGGDFEGTMGTIQSPGYPSSFAHRHICKWTIRVPEGRKVTLTFEDFDLEQPMSYGNRSRCVFDWIKVS